MRPLGPGPKGQGPEGPREGPRKAQGRAREGQGPGRRPRKGPGSEPVETFSNWSTEQYINA